MLSERVLYCFHNLIVVFDIWPTRRSDLLVMIFSMEKHSQDKIESNAIVNPKTIDVYSAFAVTLKKIHIQLVAEGYSIENGRITKSERMLEIERNTVPPPKRRKTRKHR